MDSRHRAARRPRSSGLRPFDIPSGQEAQRSGDGVVELAVLPVRNAVLLPNMVMPLFVDREPALSAIEHAIARDQDILVVAQRSEETDDPTAQDIYHIGTQCSIKRVLRLPDGATSVMVQGERRARIIAWLGQAPFGVVRAAPHSDGPVRDERIEALTRAALSSFETCARLSERLSEDAYVQALNVSEPGALADFIVAQLEPPLAVRQELLESFDIADRLTKTCRLLRHELNVLELEHKIHDEVQQEADRGQRELFLREQLRAIQRELGEHDPAMRESVELRERIEAAGMPTVVREQALKELERLLAMPSMAPEQSVLRGYLDWLVAVPWQRASTDSLDLRHVATVLDAHHYGLERIKDRILDFMAVRKLAPGGRAPILCLAGPPGVGKTSLGRSIAEALGRTFARVSLGGIRDEAEIRGHRRTYVGALPGRIIQGMKAAGTVNPVFVLDEVDKLAADFRGDPAAALLEVLDPEQNVAFSDHYLEVPYDLSRVLFILTANDLSAIPAPLRDRMEVIEIAGYTEEEKVQIARAHLIPRQMRESGLSVNRVEIEGATISRIIREYTFEAGVRNLEREIAAIMRRVARRVAEGRRHKAIVSAQRLPAYLGPQKFFPPEAEAGDEVGVATGLAWTAAGGDLTSVEVMVVPGRGSVLLTGQLGEVMRESAQAALTFTRARADVLGLHEGFYETSDIHVHLPAGSIPKDGPSAGITMALALISAFTGRAVRHDVAMTGEITLRGRVLPVGGVKEKVLAAYRAGLSTVILPRRNLKDLDELAGEVRDRIAFVPVETMDEVLGVALCPPARFPTAHAELGPAAYTAPLAPARPLSPRAEPSAAAGRVARQRSRRVVVAAGDQP
jgi:ATP-dependent Lon protease